LLNISTTSNSLEINSKTHNQPEIKKNTLYKLFPLKETH